MPQCCSVGQRAAAEHQHFGQREHPGHSIGLVDQHPADRAAPRSFDRQFVGDRLEVGVGGGAGHGLATVAERAEAALTAGDGVGNCVAIGVAHRERVQQRHAERKRVALVRGQARRFEDALEVEAAQRQLREPEVETEQRAADVPGHARRHLDARHRPRQPQARVRIAGGEPEIVPARDIVGQQHRAVGIADVGGVGDRQ